MFLAGRIVFKGPVRHDGLHLLATVIGCFRRRTDFAERSFRREVKRTAGLIS